MQAFVEGSLEILRETCEGGHPGKATNFLDNTQSDGSNNHGLFATLERLSPNAASDPTSLGLSVAAQAAHIAYHMEVVLRSAQGDRGPFDWPGSFEAAKVDQATWQASQARLKNAYEAIQKFARATPEWNQDAATGLAATVAHVAYHLGAIRQTIKLVRNQ